MVWPENRGPFNDFATVSISLQITGLQASDGDSVRDGDLSNGDSGRRNWLREVDASTAIFVGGGMGGQRPSDRYYATQKGCRHYGRLEVYRTVLSLQWNFAPRDFVGPV